MGLGSKLPSAVTLRAELVCVNTTHHSASLSRLNPTLSSDGTHRTTSLLKMSRSRSLNLQHVHQLLHFLVAHPFTHSGLVLDLKDPKWTSERALGHLTQRTPGHFLQSCSTASQSPVHPLPDALAFVKHSEVSITPFLSRSL